MKIFFTASFKGKDKYQKNYDLIRSNLKKLGVEVIGTEEGNYISQLPPKIKTFTKDLYKLHYEAIKNGIINSDATIIEMSNEDFQLGHEATLAIFSKKHVLCLSVIEDFSQKIKNEYFHGAKYNDINLRFILKDFTSVVREERLINRFNMFLSERQLDYLKEVSSKEKLNISEYIRKLVELDMRMRR